MDLLILVIAVGVGFLAGFLGRPLIENAYRTGYQVQDKLDGPDK